MNIQITAKPIEDVAAYLVEGKARREALMGGGRNFVNALERKKLHDEISRLSAQVVALRAETRSLQERLDEKDSIIRVHEQTINGLTAGNDVSGSRRPAKDIITDVLRDFPGITYAQVMGPGRSMPIVEARHTCILAVHRARPDLSFPQLGAIFGGRDHTTILFAVRKMEARLG